jgi:polo-like kinase 1
MLGSEKYNRTLVTKWVDYSSKYGIGYKLSNGCYGVLFNDSTKMILNQNCFDFIYIRRESYSKESLDSLTSHHTFADYPTDLKKKVVLIQHFKGYLDGAKYEPNLEAPYPMLVADRDQEGKEYPELFLKKWKRAKKAVLFRLSNKVIQVCYQDSSELILASGSGSVTFITA